MKISVEFYDRKITIEHKRNDLTCDEFVEQMVRPLMSGMEYPEPNIAYALGETDIDPTQN